MSEIVAATQPEPSSPAANTNGTPANDTMTYEEVVRIIGAKELALHRLAARADAMIVELRSENESLKAQIAALKGS